MISRRHPNRCGFNWLLYRLFDRRLEAVADRIKGRVYDLGCGEMPYRDWIMLRAESYVGVDWSDTMHELTADVIADLNQPLSIETEAADTVVCFSVLEHLREPAVMLGEVSRILRSGGVAIVQVPFQWRVHEAPHDYFRYTRYGLEHLLRRAGLEVLEVRALGGFWPMWVLKLTYQSSGLVRGPRGLRVLMSLLLWPFWWTVQVAAAALDRVWPSGSENETCGYMAVAIKP